MFYKLKSTGNFSSKESTAANEMNFDEKRFEFLRHDDVETTTICHWLLCVLEVLGTNFQTRIKLQNITSCFSWWARYPWDSSSSSWTLECEKYMEKKNCTKFLVFSLTFSSSHRHSSSFFDVEKLVNEQIRINSRQLDEIQTNAQ